MKLVLKTGKTRKVRNVFYWHGRCDSIELLKISKNKVTIIISLKRRHTGYGFVMLHKALQRRH